jgi:hypothetical protein
MEVDGTSVEKSRRGVEKLAASDQASVGQRMVGLAREGWNKVRGLLEGKKIVRVDGRVLLKEDNEVGQPGRCGNGRME